MRTTLHKALATAAVATLAIGGVACSDTDDDGVAPGQEQLDTDPGPGDEIGDEDGTDDFDTDPGEGDEIGGEDSATTTG